MSEIENKNNRLADSTSRSYDRRFQSLFRRYGQSAVSNHKGAWGLTGFADWVIEQQNDWTQSTWRQYRAAIDWALADPPHALLKGMGGDRHAELQVLAGTSPPAGKPEIARTSSLKVKRLTEDDHVKLSSLIANGRSRNAKNALLMFDATKIAGLRPVEWCRASCHVDDDGTFVLVVINAKDTHDRAPGKRRLLRWQALPDIERHTIISMIHLVEARTGGDPLVFSKWYEVLRGEFNRAARKCWKRRQTLPSIYTGRHIAAARFKVVCDPVQVAALMGHASDETAGRHYARPGRGKNAVRPEDVRHLVPEPDPEAMSLVRRIRDRRFLERGDNAAPTL